MKYLSTYKLFESSVEEPEPTIEYLKDIFLEVEDDGFNVDVDTLTSLYNWGHVFTVVIYKSESPLVSSPDESIRFKIKDVLETILTSESYMKSLGYKLNHIQSNEVQLKYSSVGGYDSSVLKSGRREQSKETIYLKIEFTKE
jgi:hypothetical protein